MNATNACQATDNGTGFNGGTNFISCQSSRYIGAAGGVKEAIAMAKVPVISIE